MSVTLGQQPNNLHNFSHVCQVSNGLDPWRYPRFYTCFTTFFLQLLFYLYFCKAFFFFIYQFASILLPFGRVFVWIDLKQITLFWLWIRFDLLCFCTCFCLGSS